MDHELRPALKECLRLMENELTADGRAGLGTDPSEWIVAMANARAALAPVQNDATGMSGTREFIRNTDRVLQEVER